MSTEYYPLVPARWDDLEKVFGPKGAVTGCWCMHCRQTRAEERAGTGESNRLAFKAIVESGTVPGLLAYRDSEPAGWCAIQPREAYPPLDSSDWTSRVDDRPVWSIPCFFIPRRFRWQGVMRGLVSAAAEWARQNGATIVEAYPFDIDPGVKHPGLGHYRGYPHPFLEAGFVEVARRDKRHLIVRKYLH